MRDQKKKGEEEKDIVEEIHVTILWNPTRSQEQKEKQVP